MFRNLNGLTVFLVLALLGVVTFANGLKNPKLIDDYAFFDEKVRNIKYLWIQFVPDKDRVLGLKDKKADTYYRPFVSTIALMACVLFHEDMFRYHSFCLALLVVASFMISFLVFYLWRDWRMGLLAGAVFLVHPINGIMVNYVTAAVFSVQVIFMIGCLICLLKAISYKLSAVSRQQRITAYSLQLTAMVLFILSLLCHETSLALPFYAAVIFIIVRRESWASALRITSGLWIAAILYFLWRMRFATLASSVGENFIRSGVNPFEFGVTFLNTMFWYIAKLFYPVGIVMIQIVPWASKVGWMSVAVAVILLAGIGFVFWEARKSAPALLGLSWILLAFIPLVPASVFRPVAGLTVEPHWLVFSAVGFSIWFAAFNIYLWERFKNKIITAAMSVVFVCWIIASWGMNALWGDEVAYLKEWLKRSPGYAPTITFSLGKAYEVRNDYERARYWYLKADGNPIPMDSSVLVNMALMEMNQKNWQKAAAYLNRVLEREPNLEIALSNRGGVAYMQGDYALAEELFRKAMARDRFMVLPQLNLGKVLLKTGRVDEAVKAFENVLAIVPNEDRALFELMKIYWDKKDRQKVVYFADKIANASQNPDFINYAGVVLRELKEDNKAQKAFQKAANLK